MLSCTHKTDFYAVGFMIDGEVSSGAVSVPVMSVRVSAPAAAEKRTHGSSQWSSWEVLGCGRCCPLFISALCSSSRCCPSERKIVLSLLVHIMLP